MNARLDAGHVHREFALLSARDLRRRALVTLALDRPSALVRRELLILSRHRSGLHLSECRGESGPRSDPFSPASSLSCAYYSPMGGGCVRARPQSEMAKLRGGDRRLAFFGADFVD